MRCVASLVVLFILASQYTAYGCLQYKKDEIALYIFVAVISSIWVIPSVLISRNYDAGPVWYIKPSGCNEEFYRTQGSIPPAFKDAYPNGTISVAGENGENWWIDGEKGWRLFYAPGNAKHTSKRFGLCPSYFEHHSDVNCVNFRPDDSGEYTTADNVFSAMDTSYELSNYANFGISNDQPFEPGTPRNSMRLWFDEQWLPLSMQVKRLVVSDACKILYQSAILISFIAGSNLVFGDTNLLWIGLAVLAATWTPTGLVTKAWVDTKNMETVNDPNSWEALFPYCDIIEVTAAPSYLRGVAIWYLILSSLITLVCVPMILNDLSIFLDRARDFLGIKKTTRKDDEDSKPSHFNSSTEMSTNPITNIQHKPHPSNWIGRALGNGATGWHQMPSNLWESCARVVLLNTRKQLLYFREQTRVSFSPTFCAMIEQGIASKRVDGNAALTYPRFVMKISKGDIVELTNSRGEGKPARFGRVVEVHNGGEMQTDSMIAPFQSVYSIQWIALERKGTNELEEVVEETEHNVPLVKKGLEDQGYQNLSRSCTKSELNEQRTDAMKLLKDIKDPSQNNVGALAFFATHCWLFSPLEVKRYLDTLEVEASAPPVEDDTIPNKV